MTWGEDNRNNRVVRFAGHVTGWCVWDDRMSIWFEVTWEHDQPAEGAD